MGFFIFDIILFKLLWSNSFFVRIFHGVNYLFRTFLFFNLRKHFGGNGFPTFVYDL